MSLVMEGIRVVGAFQIPKSGSILQAIFLQNLNDNFTKLPFSFIST